MEILDAVNGAAALTIRPAAERDAQAVARLVFDVLREHGLSPDPDGTDADLRDLPASYTQGGGMFAVLEDAAGLIGGCVGLYGLEPGTCELRKMYLRRDLRGRGLGRRLLEHALDRASALGFRRVTLETASVLTKAIALYVQYGFQPLPAHRLSCRCDQAYSLDLERRALGDGDGFLHP